MNTETNIPVKSLFETFVTHIIEQVTLAITPIIDAKAHEANKAIVALKVDINAFKPLVQQYTKTYVEETLDGNRTLSRLDESLDALTSRVDDLEAEDCSGISRKLKDHIDNVLQDKLDAVDVVTKDGLASAVGEVLNEGSFTINFNRY